MSVDHKVEIGRDSSAAVCINIPELNEKEREVSEIRGTLYAYDINTGQPRFTCQLSIEDLRKLYGHLSSYSVIADSMATRTGRFVELKKGSEELAGILALAETPELLPVLKELVSKRLSRSDTNIILGRKDALEEFRALLQAGDTDEPRWQVFFENNDWIFGYGLRYCFLKMLQREAHVSGTDLGGGGSVISDFLMSDLSFTKLVEIKRADTPLFQSTKNRSDSWRLSNELTDSVSQILAQKANWEIESQKQNYTKDGSLIREKTVDVDCILIIGDRSSVSGNEQQVEIKLKTLELYRRNLRNIEILTYDELFARASYIVLGAEYTANI